MNIRLLLSLPQAFEWALRCRYLRHDLWPWSTLNIRGWAIAWPESGWPGCSEKIFDELFGEMEE